MITIVRSTAEMRASERDKLKEQRRFTPPQIVQYATQRMDFSRERTLHDEPERRALVDGDPADYETHSLRLETVPGEHVHVLVELIRSHIRVAESPVNQARPIRNGRWCWGCWYIIALHSLHPLQSTASRS
jgi:hypothetical protein